MQFHTCFDCRNDAEPNSAQDRGSEWDESKHLCAENRHFDSGGASEKQPENKLTITQISEIKGDELGTWSDIKELRKKAKECGRQFVGKKFVNVQTGYEIEVSMKGVKHAISGVCDNLIKTIPAIPSIIALSYLIETKQDKHGDPNILGVEIYQAKIKVENQEKEVIMTVKHTRDGRCYYYSHGYWKQK